jgi:hypothetical protein
VDSVFGLFETLERGQLSAVARCMGFPLSIVQGWWRHWLTDPDWRPCAPGTGRRCTFSGEQKEAIVAALEKRFSIAERPLSLRSLSRVVLRYWTSHQAGGRRIARLVSGNRFRLGFMKRHGLWFRSPSLRRPVALDLMRERAVESYTQSIKAAAGCLARSVS